MCKHRFITWLVLGLLLNLQGFSQSKPSATSKTTDQCNARIAAYETAQGNCADFYQQLDYMQREIDDYKRQRDALLQQCKDAKNAKDLAACQEAASLSDTHASILAQQYLTLAQRGCQQTGLTPKQIAQTCASEGAAETNTSAPGQNKTAPPVSTKAPVKSATVPSQQPAIVRQQDVSPDRSASNTHSRPQPSPSTQETGAPAGNGFNRQSDFGGGMRGQVNTPSPAAVSAGTTGTGATGAGRVK
jgi:hypothetical protein